jgi:hypothetical protein
LWDMHKARDIVYWDMLYEKMASLFPNTRRLLPRLRRGVQHYLAKKRFPEAKEKYWVEREARSEAQSESLDNGISIYLSHYESMIQNAKGRGIEVISLVQPNIFSDSLSRELTQAERTQLNINMETHFSLTKKGLDDLAPANARVLFSDRYWMDWDLWRKGFTLQESGVETLSRKYGTAYFSTIEEFSHFNNVSLWSDQVHFTDKGNQVLAARIAKEAEPMISRWRTQAVTEGVQAD